LEIVDYARSQDVVVFPGALTPTEIITAWRAGSDFVKVVPCAAAGGVDYIRALKSRLPQIPLIPAGGVNQQTATGFIAAGAVALGIGEALIPWEAVALRQASRIRELARRFVRFVGAGRKEIAARPSGPLSPAITERAKPADTLHRPETAVAPRSRR